MTTAAAESSLAWADGALLAIDQRALPRELSWLRITTVDEVIDAIKTLAIRGAPALGVAGAFGVALAAYAHAGDAEKTTLEAERIASARPTAVNLAWGVRRALATLPAGPDAVLAEAQEMLAEDAQVNRVCATHAADLVLRLCPDRPLRVLTHCNTGRLATTAFGTALGAVRVLHARGKIADVLVDETRPLLQGARLTAWELAEAGIPHRLTIDSAAAWAMATGQVDCVIVGADRITADGSAANKIGTYALALAAQRHGIPFVVVAPESTRDLATATGREIVVEERAAAEITHVGGVASAPERTAVFNPAFDVTPAELITAIVTENGVVGPTDAREYPCRTSRLPTLPAACTCGAGCPEQQATSRCAPGRPWRSPAAACPRVSSPRRHGDGDRRRLPTGVGSSPPVRRDRHPHRDLPGDQRRRRGPRSCAVCDRAHGRRVAGLDVQWLRADQRTRRDGNHQRPGLHQSLRRPVASAPTSSGT